MSPRTRTRTRARLRPFLLAAAIAVPLSAGLAVPAGAAGAIGAIAAASARIPIAPPSTTVSSPDTGACPYRAVPPRAVDTSENLPPGVPAPAALPVPNPPVGGTRLGECGFVLPVKASAPPSDISAGAWLIADLDSGAVLAAKDPHGRYRPASTLKLLTLAVMLANLPDLDQQVAGTDEDARQEGSRVGIGPGGTYTVHQLLLFLMLGSGNDVANALARTNGGYDKTVADMNVKAAQLGALDTRAATVSGLDGPGQSTSVYDLALIARHDMGTAPFPELVSTKTSQVPACCGQAGFGIANDNELLTGHPGALGGKTGFTDDAGNTYVGMAERDGRRLVVTMLNGTQQPRRQWMQAASLLDWGFALTPHAAVGRLVASAADAAPSPTATSTPLTGTRPAGSAASALPAAEGISQPTAGGAGDGPTRQPAAEPGARVTAFDHWWPLLAICAVAAVLGVRLLIVGRRRADRGRTVPEQSWLPGQDPPGQEAPGQEAPGQAAPRQAAPGQESPRPTQHGPAAATQDGATPPQHRPARPPRGHGQRWPLADRDGEIPPEPR